MRHAVPASREAKKGEPCSCASCLLLAIAVGLYFAFDLGAYFETLKGQHATMAAYPADPTTAAAAYFPIPGSRADENASDAG